MKFHTLYPHLLRDMLTGYAQLFLDVKIPFQFFDGRQHIGVFLELSLDRLGGVDHRGVITTAKLVADRRERGFRILAA